MRHLRNVSRGPAPAQSFGVTTPIETVILLIFGVFFRDWDNGITVLQNLQKYFSKTP